MLALVYLLTLAVASADITWLGEESKRSCMQAQGVTDKLSVKLENWKIQLAVDNNTRVLSRRVYMYILRDVE